jgi:hypothetical protein
MNVQAELKYLLKSVSNIHRQGLKKNIFLFATPRGGSTWVMEVIASQPGMKYYDEPFNIRRDNVQRIGMFRDWGELMPEGGQSDRIIGCLTMLEQNRFRFMNPPPFRKNHRLLTSRIIFKIHELEHLINEIKARCDGLVLYLLRHPIATTISRHTFPRLPAFVGSAYYRDQFLTAGQLLEIERIVEHGSALERGIVSWCYENLVPLKQADSGDWLFLTYEELLLNAPKTCALLASRLALEDPARMLAAVREPAANIAMSTKQTQDILLSEQGMQRARHLVKKWKTQVSDEDEHRCFDILELFGLDTYAFGRYVSNDRYLHFPDTVGLIGQDK